MKSLSTFSGLSRRVLRGLIAANLALLPLPALAGSVALANAPLANTTISTEVLPNLMLIFDDSGSMASDYLPDWASGASTVLSKTNAYNNLYYDPAITYSPPGFFNADGTANTTTYPIWNATQSTNWTAVKENPYSGNTTYDLTTNPADRSAYVVEPGEYCSDHALKTCQIQSAPDATYKYPAPLRWCKTAANATAATPPAGSCQAVRVDTGTTFNKARTPTPRTTSFDINNVSNSATVTSIKVNNQEILSATVAATSTSTSVMAQKIVDAINACNGITTGNCGVAGFAATLSGSTITITSGKGSLAAPVVTKTGTFTTSSLNNFSTNNYPGYSLLRIIIPGTTAVYPYPGIYPGASAIAKASARTDCAATYCTGNEEMTNLANWYAYYRTRTQMMKTAVSLAFQGVDARYRVGITAQSYTGYSDGSKFRHVDKYELTQKNAFLTTLFGMPASGGTPTRVALAKVGRIFAHTYNSSAADPMQYSCQKNYSFVATDGYWNGGTGKNIDGSADVGDMDADLTINPAPVYEGPTASSNSLADIGKYYYQTDLRTSELSNCTGGTRADGSTGDVCANDWGNQRMTTFALALGISGVLDYTSDYRTATSGDYYNLKTRTGTIVNWPDPNTGSSASELPERIDDLWHATVNSDGIYFSAKSPTEVIKSLQDALGQIDKKIGSGAAAATSSLQPTSTDNFSFVASYTTVQWTGNLESRTINIATGATALDAVWCVENVVEDSCASPSTRVAVTSGASSTYVCRSPGGIDVEIASSCTGTLQSKVAASSDTRHIYMNSGTALQDFTYANIMTRGLNANFSNAFLRNNLSQRTTLTTDQLTALSGDKLVAYLRGQYSYDMRPGNEINSQLFRLRAATLGDIVESQPAYIGKPTFSYRDNGYDAFKVAQASRAGTVYVGVNDGMLHAFDSANGNERWAFVPTPVIPNMWRLADDMYSTNHRNYVNGSPVISDIFDGTNWRTILVGGLNAGGRGYYALDITNPASPALLWEFTSANDSNLGFTFGPPVITKKSNGTWVVLLTSGYNNGSGSGAYNTSPVTEIANSPAGDGKGYLYVLNATTGVILSTITTGAGSAATPSGLGKIAAWADEPTKNNTLTYAYSGDLLGNLWRFDINAGTVMKLAALNIGGVAQPIMTRAELGVIDGKRVVFVGTGKYLEQSDLSNTAQQTVYGIMDANATSTLTDPRSALVQQTLTTSGTTRSITNNAVNFSLKRGWYVDFTDPGERVNVDPILESGTLLVPTTVPTSTVCSPGGYSWLSYFNYKTGGPVTGSIGNKVSDKIDSPIVGMNIIYIPKNTAYPNGPKKPVVSVVTANNPTPKLKENIPFGGAAQSFSQKKVIWRELIQ